jgi:hypothetical protein
MIFHSIALQRCGPRKSRPPIEFISPALTAGALLLMRTYAARLVQDSWSEDATRTEPQSATIDVRLDLNDIWLEVFVAYSLAVYL